MSEFDTKTDEELAAELEQAQAKAETPDPAAAEEELMQKTMYSYIKESMGLSNEFRHGRDIAINVLKRPNREIVALDMLVEAAASLAAEIARSAALGEG